MNAPDANLLLFAYNTASPFHTAARSYLEDSLSEDEMYGLPVLSVHAFIRISTSKIWGEYGLSMGRALQTVDSWLQRPNVVLLHPGPRHWVLLSNMVRSLSLTSKQFSDAAVAAIAVEHGATLHSHDGDFAMFQGVRWRNPLSR